MAKKSPIPMTIGMVARRIAKISLEKDVAFEKAFSIWDKDYKTNALSEYDWNTPKVQSSLESSFNEKLGELKSCDGCGGKKKEKETTEKEKPSKEKKEKKSVKAQKIAEDKPKKKPAIKDNLSFVPPLAMKLNGQVDIITTEQGTLIKKGKGVSEISLLCPEGSSGKMVKEDTVGCKLD